MTKVFPFNSPYVNNPPPLVVDVMEVPPGEDHPGGHITLNTGDLSSENELMNGSEVYTTDVTWER